MGSQPQPVPNIFLDNQAAWAATLILIPVVILFAGFAFHFYMTLAKHRYSEANQRIQELDELAQFGGMLPTHVDVEQSFNHLNHLASNPQSHRSSISHYSHHNL